MVTFVEALGVCVGVFDQGVGVGVGNWSSWVGEGAPRGPQISRCVGVWWVAREASLTQGSEARASESSDSYVRW